MIDRPTELSLEQQFALQSFVHQVHNMSEEQSRNCLLWLYDQWLTRESSYRSISGDTWDIQLPNL